MRGPFQRSSARSRGGRYRISRGPVQPFSRRRFGHEQQRRALFVVPGKVIEIFFLHENVGGIRFFVARVAEQHDGGVDRGNKLRAPLGKHAQRLALPGLQHRRENRHQQKGKHTAQDQASSLHRVTSREHSSKNISSRYHYFDAFESYIASLCFSFPNSEQCNEREHSRITRHDVTRLGGLDGGQKCRSNQKIREQQSNSPEIWRPGERRSRRFPGACARPARFRRSPAPRTSSPARQTLP